MKNLGDRWADCLLFCFSLRRSPCKTNTMTVRYCRSSLLVLRYRTSSGERGDGTMLRLHCIVVSRQSGFTTIQFATRCAHDSTVMTK